MQNERQQQKNLVNLKPENMEKESNLSENADNIALNVSAANDH